MPAFQPAYPPAGPFAGRPDADQARAVLVAHLVALSTGVPAEDVAGRARGDAAAARARQTAMYLAHTAFGWPLARVGHAFGRDRTTAGHACARVEDLRDDARFDAGLCALEACLRALPEARA